MNYKSFKVAVIIIMGMALILAFTIFYANIKLLCKLKIPQPGTNIELVMDQLGAKVAETSDVYVMRNWGSIKDVSFLQDKKLFKFSVPPGLAMDIYTDTNNIITFVTWGAL